MRKINSKQKAVQFIWCPDPITIDKRRSCGDDPQNIQIAQKGVFLKMKNATTVSHLVQPNALSNAPVGWVMTDVPGLFDKSPIWISDEVIPAFTVVEIQTLDGLLRPFFDEPSMLCYNSKEDGSVDLDDVWLQKISDIQKNYEY
jgi:hypothetical protein